MRFVTAASAAFIALMPAATLAADCSDETLSLARELSAKYDDVQKELRKVGTRADSLGLRNDALPQAFRVALPVLNRPALPEELFDDDGKLVLVCDDDGSADETISAAVESLAETEAAIAAFADKVNSSRDAVSAAEEVAKDSAVVAEGSDESDDTGLSAGDRGGASDDSGDASGDAVAADATDVAGDQIAREPMANPENPNSYRRILTLPEALVFADENTPEQDALTPPVFSVNYVFDERQRDDGIWLEVGESLREGATGWLREDDTLDWSTMLVMQFAPVGQRQRTLFFEDAATLRDIMDSVQYRREAEEYYASISAEQERLAKDSSYSPQWDPSLVAIEPDVGLKFDTAPYLLPILDWQDYQFDNVIESVILKVAAVPADSNDIGDRDNSTFSVSQSDLADQDGVFRIGVTFVIDTTISMAPFIDRTRETIEAFYNTFSQYETAQFVSYGIVGFRDNLNNDDRLEYTSSVFQYLDPDAEAADVITNMARIRESQIPTMGFKEDVYAGLISAMDEQDWDPFDSRLIILITDASARSGTDALASNADVSEETIISLADQNNIAIIPVHLLTPANQSNGDVNVARNQYEAIGQATGDPNYNSYIAVDATDDVAFQDAISQFASLIAQSLLQINAGQVLSVEEMEPIPDGAGDDGRGLARAAANEIFRAQLESLAAVDTGVTPSFLAGWAADRDVTNPDNRMMDVSVYLTRNQLSTLGQQLDRIVDAFRNGGDDPATFFANLQLLAAETATDPDAPSADADDVIENILPSFLQNLPYRSEVLRIDQAYWGDLSVSARQELVEGLDEKLKIYQGIEDNVDRWSDFGADVGGLEVTLVPLTNLP